MSERRRNRPLYPVLVAALALGGCGPLEEELVRLTTRVDGGTTLLTPTPAPVSPPAPPEFIGGDAAYEILPDGGVVQ